MSGFKCWRISRQLAEYLDKELDVQASAHIAKHLQQCEVCNRHLSELRTQIKTASLLQSMPAPRDFTKQVMQRLEATQADRPARRFARPLSLARAGWTVAVFAMLLLIAGYVVRMPQHETAQKPSPIVAEKLQPQGNQTSVATAVAPKSGAVRSVTPTEESAVPEVVATRPATEELLQSVAYDEKDVQLEEAVASYQQAAGDENARQSALLDIGGIYETMGSPIAALEAYDEALTAMPQQPPKNGRNEG